MTDDLKLPQVGELTLPRWQYWLARYNEVLSEKSDRIEKLEALVEQSRDDNSSLIDSFDKDFLRQEARIEKLEAALQAVIRYAGNAGDDYLADKARKALEGKDGKA